MISNAVGVPNVKALVYIAGFAPDKGESLLKLVDDEPRQPDRAEDPDHAQVPDRK